MRWIKYILLSLILLGGIGLNILNTHDENKNFIIKKEISYNISKIFPQFVNFQNFTRWNYQFSSGQKYTFSYFSPYEGKGSSMKYINTHNPSDFGEIFIRNSKPNKTIKYEIYENEISTPYKIEIKFIPKRQKTQLIWLIETPKMSLLKGFIESISQEEIETKIEQSMKNLDRILSKKVEREIMFGQIKYDSIMIEEQEEKLLIGINTSTNNQKGNLFKNININHNKLISLVTKDLAKRDDEFGLPILITEANNLKNKEISYFYGIPLSQQEKISDNNFIFKKVKSSKVYSIYYKGKYEQRISTINQLLNQIKKDSLKNGMLEEIFLEAPSENKDVVLKISFPVTKK